MSTFEFIFCRRTNRDVLELSEISLDVNLVNSNIRYKFTDSPVLAVSIFELTDNVVILVSTVSSIHYLKFNHPNRISKNHDDVQVFSIFHEAVALSTRDSSLYYVIGHAATPSELYIMSISSSSVSNLCFILKSIISRPSFSAYGGLLAGSGWKRCLLCVSISIQRNAILYELQYWANWSSGFKGTIHYATNIVQPNWCIEVETSIFTF